MEAFNESDTIKFEGRIFSVDYVTKLVRGGSCQFCKSTKYVLTESCEVISITDAERNNVPKGDPLFSQIETVLQKSVAHGIPTCRKLECIEKSLGALSSG